MGKRLELTLLLGGHTEDLETYEKMLSITSHQRDANYNLSQQVLHAGQNGQPEKNQQTTSAGEVVGKGNPSALLVGMQTGAATVENTIWNFLRKLKMELPFDPAILLLGLYPKNPETPIQKNLCTLNVHSSTIYNSQVLEAT